jgi:hypothetical protein
MHGALGFFLRPLVFKSTKKCRVWLTFEGAEPPQEFRLCTEYGRGISVDLTPPALLERIVLGMPRDPEIEAALRSLAQASKDGDIRLKTSRDDFTGDLVEIRQAILATTNSNSEGA